MLKLIFRRAAFGKIGSTPRPVTTGTSQNRQAHRALELGRAGKCLAKTPIRGHNIGESLGYAIISSDHERERLAIEIRVGLPICTPIS